MDVWQRSMKFADRLFALTDSLPQRYQFSIGEQMRRAGLSVGANIAEGCGRGAGRDAARFYRIARGSAYEVVSLLEMLRLRSLLDADLFRALYAEADEIARMLTGLIKRNSSELSP
jgi:four helix bundle protein